MKGKEEKRVVEGGSFYLKERGKEFRSGSGEKEEGREEQK
jgi:hypothetical protein